MNGLSDSPGKRVHIAFLAWVSMLGTDLLLHGGVLARLYAAPSPFLLDAETAFARIPIGYASFLVLAALFAELGVRLNVRSWRTGLRLGLVAGGAIWLALIMGLFSIASAPWPLLAGWFAGQTLELGIAGALIGAAIGGASMPRLWRIVLVWCLAAVAVTITLQNTGLAPAARVAR